MQFIVIVIFVVAFDDAVDAGAASVGGCFYRIRWDKANTCTKSKINKCMELDRQE